MPPATTDRRRSFLDSALDGLSGIAGIVGGPWFVHGIAHWTAAPFAADAAASIGRIEVVVGIGLLAMLSLIGRLHRRAAIVCSGLGFYFPFHLVGLPAPFL